MKFERTTLGAISKGNRGYYGIGASAVPFSSNLYTYLRITDINDDGTLNHDDLKSVADEKASEYVLQPDDIVFARTGASTGRNYFYDGSDGTFVYAGFLIKFSLDKNLVNPRYIKYYCQSKDYLDWIASYNTGSTRGNINAQTLATMPLLLPQRKFQNQIVEILDVIEERRKINNQVNDNLFQQAKTIFDTYYNASKMSAHFVSFIEILGGGTPKTSISEYWNGDIPFFTPKDIGSPYTFQTEKYITETGLDHCNSRLYPKNTSFVTARGTVGKVSLAGKPMAMNQSCYALMSKTLDPILVYFYTLKAVDSLKHKASGAVFDAIVTRDFESEVISVISDKDSEKLLSIIKPMMEAIHSNTEEIQRLTSLRDTLLPRLMSGEIDVSNIAV